MPSAAIGPSQVKDFRSRHGLTAEEMDRLFGYSSKGRATRLWESNGAPTYVGVLMNYMDKFGLGVASKTADQRKAA